MTIYKNVNRAILHASLIAWLGVWLFTVSTACADQVVLFVEDVPEHGLVAKHVDLTAAVARCKIDHANPSHISATDRDGNPAPFQFIPDPDFDLAKKATGLIVARLTPNRPDYLKLQFTDKSKPQSIPTNSIETLFYTVHHNTQKGGLPDKITFNKTGKLFDNFRWQDRLHHKNLGGFTLQNDNTASVECLTTGPLCTAVRVKAGYLNPEGKSPPSKPQAIYTWIYLHDLPLIFVTAEVTQAQPFEWNELHFLELNFPGEDFKSWAGGEPLSKGTFQATGKSHNAANWGALIEGRDAIAMFDSGGLIFHDGRGAYGTYLHAHGDRAWKPWSQLTAQFSAWLWIGSDTDAIKKVQTFANHSPSVANIIASTTDVRSTIDVARKKNKNAWRAAMAEQLEATGRLEQAVGVTEGHLLSNWTRIQAGDLNLVLEKAEQGMRVLSLFDESTAQELLAPNSPGLFSLEVRHIKNKEQTTLSADSGWRRIELSDADTSGSRVLTFQDPLDNRLKGISAEVSLCSDNKNSSLTWDMQVANDNEQLSLWRVVFPQITVKRLGEDAKVFLPHTAGIEISDIWNTPQKKGGTYPSGWTSMQYMAAYDTKGRTGLYIGMHDPYGSTKDIFAQSQPDQRAVTFTFEHPVPDMGKPRSGFDLPGEAKWQLLRGDWFDAATIYRTWVKEQAKWWPTLGPDGRSDTPRWMRELPAWAMTGGSASDCVPRLKAFAKELGLPIGFHWYNWHQIPFDNDYPHYFPVKDGFADGVAQLEEANVHVMPYINGRLWDTHDKDANDWRFTQFALPAATKDEHGNPYTESYGSKESDGNNVTLAVMCPTTPLWQNKVRDIVLRLFNEYKVSSVYIDQIAAAQPRLCFDASHGHPLGGGHWWTQGYWQLLDAIRAAKPAQCMITTECNAEPYIKWFDGYLTWHWQYQNMVPAFPAVYGGSIQMFGRAYRAGPTQDLANRMKAAQQLVFGEQIGWFGPEIAQRPDSWNFVRDCIQLRWRLKEYFYAGHMARPPKLLGDIPKVTADWQWSGTWPITTDAAMTGAWQIENKTKTVLLFANPSDHPISAHIKFNPKDYGLQGKSYNVIPITPNTPQNKLAIDQIDQHKIDLPPRSTFAWEIVELIPKPVL